MPPLRPSPSSITLLHEGDNFSVLSRVLRERYKADISFSLSLSLSLSNMSLSFGSSDAWNNRIRRIEVALRILAASSRKKSSKVDLGVS